MECKECGKRLGSYAYICDSCDTMVFIGTWPGRPLDDLVRMHPVMSVEVIKGKYEDAPWLVDAQDIGWLISRVEELERKKKA